MVKIEIVNPIDDGFYNIVLGDIYHECWLDKSDLLELKNQIDNIIKKEEIRTVLQHILAVDHTHGYDTVLRYVNNKLNEIIE